MKKKISLLLAITMLLSGCNTAEKTEQTATEITTTTTAETTALTTTTAETTTTTLITDMSTLSETIATAETEELVKAENFDLNFTSEDFTMDLSVFEKYFYGSWNEQTEYPLRKTFTYNEDSFIEGRYYCLGFYEDETGGYMLTMSGGVHELYFVLADSPDTMYTRMDFNFYYKDIGYCDIYKADENNSELSRELTAGMLDSMGALKLKADYGFDIKSFNSFTDAYGAEWLFDYDFYYYESTPYCSLEAEPSAEKIVFSKRYICRNEPHKVCRFISVAEKHNGEWRIIENTELLKTPIYNGVNGEVFYLEDADISQEPFYAYHFTYVHTGGEIFRINEGDEYGDYSIRSARHIFYPYEDEFVEWGGSYQFDDTVTLNGKLETFKYMGEDEPELFLTITVDENPGFPFPYYIYDDYPFQEILINLGKPEKYSNNDQVMDFVENKDIYSGEKFSVSLSYLCIAWVDSNMNQSSGYIESINDIIDM